MRAFPFTTWLRMARVIEGRQTVALLVGADRLARSAGGVTIALDRPAVDARRLVGCIAPGPAPQRHRAPPARHYRALTERSGMPPLFAVLRSPAAAVGVVEVAREFSPRVQRKDPGCAVCDVSGLGRLLGTPAAIGAEIARTAAAYGVPMQIAVAPTMTMGLVLTLQTLEAGVPAVSVADDASVLAVLPLRHLERLVCGALTGTTAADGRQSSVVSRQSSVAVGSRRSSVGSRVAVGSRGRSRSRRLRSASSVAGPGASRRRRRTSDTRAHSTWRGAGGCATIGELAALPPGELSARMGQEGVALQQLALGRDPGPLVPDPDMPRFIERMELEWPLDTLEPLSFVLARLLEPLSSALERADRGAAALRLDLRLVDRDGAHACAAAAGGDARSARAAHAAAARSRIASSARRGRHRHGRDRSGARAGDPVLAARAGGAVGGNRGDADRAAVRAGRRDAAAASPALLDTHRPDGFEMRRFEIARRCAALRRGEPRWRRRRR